MFHIFKQKTGLRLFWQGGAVACLLVASGCVDQRYDLTGDLDWTIGVGGQELAIPIGQTERITLEKLIGAKDDELKVMPDGTYALYKEDSLYFDVKEWIRFPLRLHRVLWLTYAPAFQRVNWS